MEDPFQDSTVTREEPLSPSLRFAEVLQADPRRDMVLIPSASVEISTSMSSISDCGVA